MPHGFCFLFHAHWLAQVKVFLKKCIGKSNFFFVLVAEFSRVTL
jgi:hypothetical protein